MLDEIIIENFQSHKETKLEFVPGVNVIIGASDSGKSAILRALNWAATNRPLGDSFRSEWGGETKVGIRTIDAHKVERIRTASKNEYILDGEPLKAFGTEVPEEVTNILLLDSYNIQSQMDPPFLLSHTPGEAARMLNKAASIDDIDRVISGISSSLNRINSDIKYKEKQLKENEEKIIQYAGLSDIESYIEELEAMEKEQTELMKKSTALNRLKEKIERTQLKLEKSKHVPILLESLAEAEESYATYRGALTKKDRLCKIVHRIKYIQGLLAQTEEIGEAAELIEGALEESSQLKAKQEQLRKLESITAKMKKAQAAINTLNKDIEKTEKEYEQIVPDACPLCGNSIGKGERK